MRLRIEPTSGSTASTSQTRKTCFEVFLLVRPDTREDYSEERWIGIGMIRGRVAFVAFAAPAQDTVRIISLRKANREEQSEYEKAIQDGLETN
jgi:hypothetical protein